MPGGKATKGINSKGKEESRSVEELFQHVRTVNREIGRDNVNGKARQSSGSGTNPFQRGQDRRGLEEF